MSEQRHSGEYHHADPAYRKQMTILLVVSVVVGAIFLLALQQWLAHLSATLGASDPYRLQSWLQRILATVCVVLAVSGAGLALWIYRVGKQTRLERRWPPSAMRTTRDVRIRYLTSADALVSQLMLLAGTLSVFSLILLGFALWLLRPA
jgi:cation transport ATPase